MKQYCYSHLQEALRILETSKFCYLCPYAFRVTRDTSWGDAEGRKFSNLEYIQLGEGELHKNGNFSYI